ncbi:NACHT domain-containing protein [Streptomyces atratus]|uniref:NACHT domain-containing protein n=1 Tax=Streptomyces atratus TaxID=1893 RepID=A0A1K2D235_STRAR|nr:NACHT domain-containing protein [Streptomyces atratus]SFY16740.1 NACHT domain-containing protein [Streptomyces atratus]
MTTGKWYGLLVVVGIAGGVVAALTLHGEKIGVASATLLALAPMYLAWVAYRREHAGATDLDAVADELAAAVRPQWEKEAAGRQINDSYTLPVAWGSVDDTLMEPWPRLADVARSWPGGAPGDPAEWPADAAGLAGDGAQIGDVFSRRIPTRRLVVLGEPGSGKTVLLIRLLLDLIQRRQSGDPVPVLFSLASWDPVQPLNVWMVERLQSTYPSLRAPASRSRSGPSLAQSLLEAGRIVPLLDGFDELPPALHAVALDTLNRSLPARQAAVLTSRTEPYRAALNGPDVTVRFNSAAVVRLLPLSPELAADYLQRGGGAADAPAMERWRNVAAQLGSGSAVGQSLSTPLGLFLARTSYNRRPQVRTWTAPDPAPHPDRLCDTAVYPTRADLDAHLFNAYIPAAYGWDGAGEPRWNAVEAGQYLGFLARHLEDNRGGSPDLAWWELHEAVPAFIRRLSAGCMGGLAMALGGGFLYGSFDHVLMTWPMCWAMFTLMFSIPATMRPAPLDPLRPWSLRTFGIGLAYAITYGIALAVLVAVTALGRVDTDDIVTMADVELSGLELANYGFLAGLAGGILFGIMIAVPLRMRPTATASSRRLSPRLFGIGTIHGAFYGFTGGFLASFTYAWWPYLQPGRPTAGGTVQSTGILQLLFAQLLLGVLPGIVLSLVCGIAYGVAFGIPRRVHPRTPNAGMRLSFRSFVVGFAIGFVPFLGLSFLPDVPRSEMIMAGCLCGVISGLFVGLVDGLRVRKADQASVVGPTALLALDRRTFWVFETAGAAVCGLVCGFMALFANVSPELSGSEALEIFLPWTGFGTFVGVLSGFKRAAWGRSAMARIYLASRRRVPFRLMAFLEDAHERGVLRKVGATYQFRHIDLQRHLAQRHATVPSPRSPHVNTPSTVGG